MEKETEHFILEILARHLTLTLATNREDGWPQATTVGYVNDGLQIYVVTFPQAQKVYNIERDPRVSLTIDSAEQDWNKIKGLSMAAMAEVVTGPEEAEHVSQLMLEKFPQIREFPEPEAEDVTILRLTPKVISVLNYEKGFGNTELIEV
jgi:nitroimidazol reductase NimA-like FMN-containing flavoprotein (pyridoxamine 5'-phosphate oxidase superfamily)